jgi:hypothetical protein
MNNELLFVTRDIMKNYFFIRFLLSNAGKPTYNLFGLNTHSSLIQYKNPTMFNHL